MLKIYDSQKRELINFTPIEEGKVKLYLCGPTVYAGPHLGHGRSAVAFDVVRRYLELAGYEVNFVSNYTDIDDKMIKRANKRGISVKELSEEIIPIYEKEYGDLKVLSPTTRTKATDFISEMVTFIEKLEKKGFTYLLDDGVYFDIKKYEKYGSLSNQNLEELMMGVRVKVNDQKKNPQDFVLWKFKKEGEPSWQSPWGEGRPGWHLECSVMSFQVFGENFDIHGGGLDLLFPHHECEVAQSKALFGEDSFAKYWLHNGFINVDNEKMSKSLGNFFTLEEIFSKFSARVVRFMYLQTHYRNPINFSDQLLKQAEASLDRIDDFIRKLNSLDFSTEDATVKELIKGAEENFLQAMNTDFDTSGALASLFEVVKHCNKLISDNKFSFDDKSLVIEFINYVNKVFALFDNSFEDEHDSHIDSLIYQREEARKGKNFELADRIRDELLEKGIELEDSPQGTVWKKVNKK